MKEKTVEMLVAEALRVQGYDGLFSESGCACELSDLAPCGEMQHDCMAGHKHTVTEEDYESDRFAHLDVPPTKADIGKYWVMLP